MIIEEEIIIEEILRDVFNTLPAITVSGVDFKPQFDFGTKEDLLKFMDAKTINKEPIYPLIWLETPILKTGSHRNVDFPCRLILATATNSTKTNVERLEVTFKPTLNPLYLNVLEALNQSGRTKILNRRGIKRTNFFNFNLKELAQEKTTVSSKIVWDAIRLECGLQVNNNICPIKIIYN